MNETTRLIIHADDFGLCKAVNRGIADCLLTGAVTSTSLMVNGPAYASARDFCRRHPHIDTGLHVTLTCGVPVSNPHTVPSLVDAQGRFLDKTAFFKRYARGGIDIRDVARECHAQMKKLTADGLRCTHLDSHHHVHVLPRLAAVIIKCAQCFEIRHIRFFAAPWKSGLRPVPVRAFVHHLGLFVLQIKQPAVKNHARFCGLDFEYSTDKRHRLEHLIDALDAGLYELMVHPASGARIPHRWATYRRGRMQEFEVLMQAQFRHRDISLISFNDIVLL